MNTDPLKLKLQNKIQQNICLSILTEAHLTEALLVVGPTTGVDEKDSDWLTQTAVQTALLAGTLYGPAAARALYNRTRGFRGWQLGTKSNQPGTEVAKQATKRVATQVGTEVAKQATKRVATQAGTEVAKQATKRVATQAGTKAAKQATKRVAIQAAKQAGTRLVAAAPAAGAAAVGTAIGLGIAYGANSALDAMDSDSWKTGGSRAKTQWDLMTGDREAWGNVRDAILNPAEIQADIEQQRIRNRSQIELQQELNKLKNEIERPNNPISEEEYVNRVTKLINDPKYKQNS
jgi:hypothetical protein